MRLSNTSYQTHSKAIIDFLNGSYVKLGMCAHSRIRLNDSHAFTFVYIQNKILPIELAVLKILIYSQCSSILKNMKQNLKQDIKDISTAYKRNFA